MKKDLADFAKQLYIDRWLEYANEDEDEPDIEKETKNALKDLTTSMFFFPRQANEVCP